MSENGVKCKCEYCTQFRLGGGFPDEEDYAERSVSDITFPCENCGIIINAGTEYREIVTDGFKFDYCVECFNDAFPDMYLDRGDFD